MKKTLKLALNLDQLAVESFEIANPRQMRGTVRGHDVCSDACTFSCAGTCGILPASAESECNALPRTQVCQDTNGVCASQPCCA
ncbi:MAG TPA: hypothetical protein VF092_24320 [Longimicrobium sp.]